jgi:hypothetical protein
MRHALCIAALLIAPLAFAADQFFPDKRCKISAPTGYAWLDPAIIPGAIAVAADESEEMLVLLVAPAPDGQAELSDELIGYLEEGLLGGELRKISGQRIEFKDLSAWEVHVQAADESIITVRFFIAHGFMYQLQIAGCKLPVSARDNLSLVFERFEFMSESEAAEVAATIAAMEAERQAEAEAESRGPGARNAVIIVVALGLFVLVLVVFVIGVRRLASQPEQE